MNVDLCPVCRRPAHASETDDAGRHPRCNLSPTRPEHKAHGRYRGLIAIEWRGYFGRSGSGIRMTEGEARMLKARQRQLAQ